MTRGTHGAATLSVAESKQFVLSVNQARGWASTSPRPLSCVADLLLIQHARTLLTLNCAFILLD